MKALYSTGVVCLAMTASTALGQGYSQFGTNNDSASPGAFNSSEPTHLDIVNQISAYTNLDGSFVYSGNGRDMESQTGRITLTRVFDYGGDSPLDVKSQTSGSYDDQVWKDGTVNAKAKARYASYGQRFGYYEGSSDQSGDLSDNFNELLTVQGSGTNVSGSSSPFTIDGTFRWGRSGGSGGNLDQNYHSSLNSDNEASYNQGNGEDGAGDHMMSYRITDSQGELNGGRAVWLLFWEDMSSGGDFEDWDYNDMVIEVAVIPLPAPLAMGMAGLAGLGMARRIRRAKK